MIYNNNNTYDITPDSPDYEAYKEFERIVNSIPLLKEILLFFGSFAIAINNKAGEISDPVERSEYINNIRNMLNNNKYALVDEMVSARANWRNRM